MLITLKKKSWRVLFGRNLDLWSKTNLFTKLLGLIDFIASIPGLNPAGRQDGGEGGGGWGARMEKKRGEIGG